MLLPAYCWSVSSESDALYDSRQGTFRMLSVQYILKFGSLMRIMQCHSATSELFFYTVLEKTERFVIPCDGHRNRCLVLSAIISLPLLVHYHHLRPPPLLLFLTKFESKPEKKKIKLSYDINGAYFC